MSEPTINQSIVRKLDQKIQQLNMFLIPEGRIQLNNLKHEFITGLISLGMLTRGMQQVMDNFHINHAQQQVTKEAQQLEAIREKNELPLSVAEDKKDIDRSEKKKTITCCKRGLETNPVRTFNLNIKKLKLCKQYKRAGVKLEQ